MSRCFTLLSDSQNMRISQWSSRKKKTKKPSSLGNPPNTTSSLSHSLVFFAQKKQKIFKETCMKPSWILRWYSYTAPQQKNNSSTTMAKIQNLNYVKNIILGRIREVYSKNIKLWNPKKNGSVKGQLVGNPIIFPSSYRPKPRPEGFRSDGLASVFILGRPGEQSYLAVRIGPMSRVYLSKISIISIYVQYLSI